MAVMQTDPYNQLTSNQAMFILFGSIVGVGILTLPRDAAQSAGQDAWISVLLGGCIPLFVVVMIALLGRRLPGLTLVEMTDAVFGRYLGKVFSLIYIIWPLLLIIVITRHFIFIVNNYLLPQTPVWVLVLLILLAVGYLAKEDAKVLGRISELFFYLAFPVYFLLLPSLHEASILNFLPVGDAGLQPILKGAVSCALVYSGSSVLLVILPFITRPAEVLRIGLKGVIVTILTYFYMVVIAISVFGGDGVRALRWPVLVLLKTVEVPVIERMEFLFLIMWVPVFYRVVAVHWFAAAFSCARMLGLRNHKLVVWAVLPLLFVGMLLIRDVDQLGKYATWVGLTGIAIDVLLPLCLLAGAILLKKGGCRHG